MQERTEKLDRALGSVNANFGQDWKKTIDDVFDEVTLKNLQQLISAIIEASTRRARPCLMTSATTILVLLPVLTSQGKGAEIMIPMAIPIFGGMCFAALALFFNPLMFFLYYKFKLKLK